MKRRIVSRVLYGQDICLFCSLRPRYEATHRSVLPAQSSRHFSTPAARAQQPAVKESEQDDDYHGDEPRFTMLKQNAALSTSFPTRPKPKPVQPAPPPPSVTNTKSYSDIRPKSDDAHKFNTSRTSSLSIRKQTARDTPPPQSHLNRSAPQRRNESARSPFPDRAPSSEQRYQPRESQNGFGHRGRYGPAREGGRPEQVNLHSQSQPPPPPPPQSQQLFNDNVSDLPGLRISRQSGDYRPFVKEDSFPRIRRVEMNQMDQTLSGNRGLSETPRFERQQSRSNNRSRFSPGVYTPDSLFGREREVESSRESRPTNGRQAGGARGSWDTRYKAEETEKSAMIGEEAEVSDIDAPAGSSFGSTFDEGSSRHVQRSRRRGRSERLEIEEREQQEEQTSNHPSKTQAQGANRAFDFELEEAEALLYGDGGRKKKKSKAQKLPKEVVEPTRPTMQLPDFITVERLARMLKIGVDQFVNKLEEEGFEGARYDHVLDSATSTMFADLYGFEPVLAGSGSAQDLVARPPPDDVSTLPPRPPIVTIMGHVDHGKTTILDYLRKSSVVASEHGGITQHIGAFSVTMPGTNRQITFLDTPGHAAFLEMRRRGANVTDIVVLVVAADDSVKPQTIEAIKHALEANVQLIVAINKVDKPDADIERVKQDLTRHEIVVEDYGGDYQAIALSGKTGQGMDELEEAIITLADVSDFRAEADGQVEGTVLESKVTAAGRVATVLVRRGTLRIGDLIVAGTTWARVRTLRNDAGALVSEASPGTPVQVDGWRAGDPDAGHEVLQANDEDHAKDVVALRLEQQEIEKTATDLTTLNTTRTEDAEARAKVLAWESEQEWAHKGYRVRPKDNAGWVEIEKDGGVKEVPFVIKTDVAGSAEAVEHAVTAIGNNEITTKVIHSAVGEVTEFDVRRLAVTGEVGFIINFNQPVDHNIARLAEAAGLKILNHNIIYKVTDEVKEKLAAELPPIVTQRVLGEAEVGAVFDVTVKRNKVKIAGCRVTNGTISRSHKVRVLRGGETVYTGTLHSLKNVKKDVTEMRKGTECGMGFENWEDFQQNDQIQCFEEVEEKRTLY